MCNIRHFETPYARSQHQLCVLRALARGHGGRAFRRSPRARATEPGPVDLQAAGQMIDILALLEEKTRGNLTAEERQLLDTCCTNCGSASSRRKARKRESSRLERAARVIVLGTGTSHGVPMIGCECGTCRSTDPRDQTIARVHPHSDNGGPCGAHRHLA